MKRKFTRRKNGEMMTTFRIRVDLTEREINDLVGRNYRLGGDNEPIERILKHCLTSGIERLTLDGSLD
jgi:hypothetical protein